MSSFDNQPSTQNTRSAIEIVWSCLFIIFTCTWTAIHPNVPPPRVSLRWWRKLWWRIKITLWTLMVPEMIVYWAACQWKEARRISARAPKQRKIPSDASDDTLSQMEMSLLAPGPSLIANGTKSEPQVEWTHTHSYFLLMGGFAVPVSEEKDSWRHIPVRDVLGGQCRWPCIKEVDILNVTKGEALAKIITVLQVSWFVSQLCGRGIQHLAITELEIVTLAYAIMSTALYILWFGKPYDVQRPIFVDEPSCSCTEPSFESFNKNGLVTGRWLWTLHERAVGDPQFASQSLSRHNTVLCAQNIALLFTAILFGGVHLFAWNFRFPFASRFIMWISISLCIYLLLLVFFLFVLSLIASSQRRRGGGSTLRALGSMLTYLLTLAVPIVHNAYLIARIILVVHSFVRLRDLSPSAMQTVSWSSFFPHI